MPPPLATASREASGSATTELAVSGMNCDNCVRHVTQALQNVPGVRSATVSLESNRAAVRWDSDAAANIQALVRAVKEAGYAAQPVEAVGSIGSGKEIHGHAGEKFSFASAWQFNVMVGLAGTVPLMLGEWVFQLGLARWFQWMSFALASLVQIFCGARFYRGALTQLQAGKSNMDTLVALGSTTAFVYSAWGLLAGWRGHLYFMEAAAIITLISVGHWLESRMSARAASSLKALLHLAPERARQLSEDGKEIEVPVANLRVEDTVILKPGDRVPTDGEVLEGSSAVDESMLTGESVPVDKTAKDKLYAGTVNLNGRLLMRVEGTGDATALAQIIAAVQRAQTSRANIQRLGDQVSSIFVPVVILIAVATGLWWGLAPVQARNVAQVMSAFLWTAHPPAEVLTAAIVYAAGVLIVACPCAMGLATPVAIMAGTNAAAQRGILIRDGVALEKAGKINAVIFDKTGTLTQGKPAVAKVVAINDGMALPDLTNFAAALARYSTHPLSQAVAKLSSSEIVLSDWREIRGSGVEGKWVNATRANSAATVQSNQSLTPALSPSEGERVKLQPIHAEPQSGEHSENVGISPSSDGERVKSEGLIPLNDCGSGSVLVRLGSLKWLSEAGVDLAHGAAFVEEWSRRGATLLGLAVDKKLAGLLALEDPVKPGAAKVIQQLVRAGHKVCLVTGDNGRTASAIAKMVGISPENIFAEVRPEEKASLVKTMQQRGERVAFVGDGINDAPALEQADLGIAVSRASDVAREAADIILLNSEIEAVPESLGLAKATLRTIKQNLFWAFFYNAAAVPLAALGFLSPVLCALAMGMSDLVVIGNALRLRRWKLRS